MKKITIAVGSKRGPKLNAITEALQSFSAALAHDTQFKSSAWKWRAESATRPHLGMN